MVLRGRTELARWPLDGVHAPGLDTVDGLARFQLVAKRLGWVVTLEGACPRLRELLELAGLGDVLPVLPASAPAAAASGRKVLGQSEGGEQCGVDEVVVPDDPVT